MTKKARGNVAATTRQNLAQPRKNDRQVSRITVPCPHCGAPVGVPCSPNHNRRRVMALRKEREVNT